MFVSLRRKSGKERRLCIFSYTVKVRKKNSRKIFEFLHELFAVVCLESKSLESEKHLSNFAPSKFIVT